jgi:hypothetical protein
VAFADNVEKDILS